MTDKIRVLLGDGKTAHERAGQLCEEIKAAVYRHADYLTLAAAIGALEIAKLEILQEQEGEE